MEKAPVIFCIALDIYNDNHYHYKCLIVFYREDAFRDFYDCEVMRLSIWSKANFQQVDIFVQGHIQLAHVHVLTEYILERYRFGYQKIRLQVEAAWFDNALLAALDEVRQMVEKCGGDLLISLQPTGA